ncbi:hypothetical protein FQA39_LY03179 [Lamprigera yunnana]|nr:hypothetical protein FQA39_LY03179 [Lamprigera yunnana]
MSFSEIVNEADEAIVSKPTVIRNASDVQRLKLDKLMKHPDRPILLPEKPKERGIPVVPEFVRNVMGSSAGAGSGEFHVYRHLRRKEYARQKYMREKGERERLDQEYHEKLEDNKRKADQKTAKKRAKRIKRKNRKGSGKPLLTKSDSEEELSDSAPESNDDECKEKVESPKIVEEANEDNEKMKGENTEKSNQEILSSIEQGNDEIVEKQTNDDNKEMKEKDTEESNTDNRIEEKNAEQTNKNEDCQNDEI